MSVWSDVRERVGALLHGARADRELREELRAHIELDAAARIARGAAPDVARREAEASFGGEDRHYEATRDARGIRPLEDFVQDVRYGVRTLRRNPGFTVSAVLVLALGIGATTAIFSAVNAVVLRPLPFAKPGQLYMLWEENPEFDWYQQTAAPANMLDWDERVASFADVAGYLDFRDETVLTGYGEPRVLRQQTVTGNFFSTLGVRAALGRTFTDAETWETGEQVVVISDRMWRDVLGADPGIVNRTLVIDGAQLRVVGVMPADFTYPTNRIDYWRPTNWPVANREQLFFRRAHFMRVVARLRDGATPDVASAQLETVAEQLKTEYPLTNRVMGAGMTPLHEFLTGSKRTPLVVLLCAAGLLLLIGCANVGNLMLVRASGRQHEIAMRAALGAARFRLVRQMLTESLVLSSIGGVFGLFIGVIGTRVLTRLQPAGMLPEAVVNVDARVVSVIVATTVLCGLIFGCVPAMWAGRAGGAAALREGGRSGAVGRSAHRLAGVLVIAEVALALLLVTGAGLLVRSFQQLTRVNPGLDTDGVLAVSVELPGSRYDTDEKVLVFFDVLLERLRGAPGVTAVGATNVLPLLDRGWTSEYVIAGRGPEDVGAEVVHRTVTPEYMSAMRVPVLRGRPLATADRANTDPVLLINDVMAREQFASEDPIGQRIAFNRAPDSTTTWYTIVGVVGGERQRGMEQEPQIEVLTPFAQDVRSGLRIMLRTDGDPLALLPSVKQALGQMDADLPIFEARAMDDVRAEALAPERFLMLMLLVFAGVALVLSTVGVFGVMAQFTRQRRQEIGVRLALGALPGDVVRTVVARGATLVAAGIAIGLVAAVASAGTLSSLLYNVEPHDLSTFVFVALSLIAVGIAASWIPAQRASRFDPSIVLRRD